MWRNVIGLKILPKRMCQNWNCYFDDEDEKISKTLEVLLFEDYFVHNTKNTKRSKKQKKVGKFRFYFQTKFLNYINNSAENSIYLMLKEVTVCLIKLFFVHIAAK